MKNRISFIVDTKRKKAGVEILCLVLVGIITTGATFATTAADDSIASFIGITENQTVLTSTDSSQTWMSEEEF